MLNRDYYMDYCRRFNAVWEWLGSLSFNKENVAEEICTIRKYESEDMYNTLLDVGFLRISKDTDLSKLNDSSFKDLGLVSKEGNFLLSGRYILPVKDMLGNVVALIGWYPDEKRYITTPSLFFSKGGMFFGMDQLKETGMGQKYYLVEGIFDSLSVRSLGFNCIAQMGNASSIHKEVLYGLFKRLVAIPDCDSGGKRVVESDLWHLPFNSSYMTWVQRVGKSGKIKNFIKDVDDLCKYYEKEILEDLFTDVLLDEERVISFEI